VPTDAGCGLTMAKYFFSSYFLDVDERRLLRDNEELRLRGKLFDTLRVLVENAGKLVRKDAFMESVWPDSVVEDNNLDYCISQLRKLFHPEKYIETVPRHGYRFVAEVTSPKPQGQSIELEPAVQRPDAPDQQIEFIETVPRVGYRFPGKVESAGKAPISAVVLGDGLKRQEIRYCMTSDQARLAYASIGNGPPLVKASNWLTHLDYEWESPIWRHWWAEFSKHHRMVRYDERGNGMSQRDVTEISFDTWIRDLETVVDAAGLDRFSMLGISRGGSIAIAYAVKHPERVSKLVLYGAFPAGLNHHGSPKAREARRALESLVRLGWGVNNPAFCKMFTCRFVPNATPAHEHWFDDLQRVSTSAENAARLMEIDDNIDVRGLLRQIRVPTLVVHCDGDQVVPPECGRQMAAEIPDARYVSLPSANHLLLAEEPAWPIFLTEIGSFLEW
jgi:pimeloyl-ACP methyl ester carboxylesterase/DNA-binding winged helix-turn-helix (wHTH) protein